MSDRRRKEDNLPPERVVLSLADLDVMKLLGSNDANLRLIRGDFTASIVVRGEELRLEGAPEEVAFLRDLFQDLMARVRRGTTLTENDILYSIEQRRRSRKSKPELPEDAPELLNWRGKVVPQTVGQREYVRAISGHDLVFAIGPAGTGKTYVAMAAAVAALKRREVDRIALVRPAVEAGESLGFLPGDFTEKVGPYLRPLHDALYEMMPTDKIQRSLDMGIIEVAPLAYMRGRTLNSSFVILDEAQNTTLDQMKMFLTRLGFNSKAVVTGDVTQIDLREKETSGLVKVQSILKGVRGLRFVYLTEADVVRHRLVQEIIKAFDRFDAAEKGREKSGEGNTSSGS